MNGRGRPRSIFPRAVVACALLGAAVSPIPSAARAGAAADTSLVWRWSALYSTRLFIERAQWWTFPWNDRSTDLEDRIAFLGELTWKNSVTLFAKGATGRYGLDWPFQDEQFILEQGHLAADLFRGAARVKLFSRENVFLTNQRLITLSSNDNGLVPYADGARLDLTSPYASLVYLESRLYDPVERTGGLPTFYREREYFRSARLEAFQKGRWHAGFLVSELNKEIVSDFTVGVDAGVTVGRVNVIAELARAERTTWGRFREERLFPLNSRSFHVDRFGDLFSADEAFAVEAEGLSLDLGRRGVVGFIPGYRYTGSAFEFFSGAWPQTTREGYALAWWKPSKYDALISLDAAHGFRIYLPSMIHDPWVGEEFDRLVGSVRTRFRGGFETRETVLYRRSGSDPFPRVDETAAAITLIDDNALSRLAVTARIDDLGEENEFSYLAQGTVNLGARITAKSALLLFRSDRSLYHIEIELRPRERFLLQVSAGSFTPGTEELGIDRDFEYGAYNVGRFVRIFARVWFDGGGAL